MPVDTVVRIAPSPRIVNLEHRRQTGAHGETAEGDLMLKGLLQSVFPEEEMLGNSLDSPLRELFWLIGDRLYVTASIEKRQVTWSVAIKKTNKTYKIGGD